MTGQQAALEQVKDLPVDQANVELVRIMGVKLSRGRIPATVRKALNQAVKDGRLGHLKKEKFKPEAYFHPNSENRAIELRNIEHNKGVEALRKAFA